MKKVIKQLFPRAVALYHKINKTLKAFMELPPYIYIEETNIKIPARNWMVYAIYSGGGNIADKKLYYEKELTSEFKKLLSSKKNKDFFDVGAGMGYYSFIAAASGARVAAFEPVDALANFVRRGAKMNGLKMSVFNDPIGEDGKIVTADIGIQKTTKKSISLDAFAKNHFVPGIIKIDVDGNEKEIIENGEGLFKNHPLDVFLEIRKETQNLAGTLKRWGFFEKMRLGDSSDSMMILFSKK
ncbi:MAG: FkbM family methyltransferase [Candidatus Liptonbacteria bacterium]|nr:FkbM family methyltransferase [Candidatus Liptonbacteria bacterium]